MPIMTTGHELVAADFDPVVTSPIGVAASGFTDAGCQAKALFDNHLVFMRIIVTNTAAITATTGDFTDVPVFTVDPAFRPPSVVNAVFGNGHSTGEAVLQSDGQVLLRAASDTIVAASTIRITFFYMAE